MRPGCVCHRDGTGLLLPLVAESVLLSYRESAEPGYGNEETARRSFYALMHHNCTSVYCRPLVVPLVLVHVAPLTQLIIRTR